MKTIILILVAVLSISDKYTEQMQKHIMQVYQAKSADDLQQSINALERIALAEKNKWEPYYYAAFAYVMMSNHTKEGSQKDLYLDKALSNIKSARANKHNESELDALEGFVHMMRVSVDPASRGQQYSGMAFQSFGKALAMNPNNPRALYLMAQMQFGTAQFFNQSTDEACGTLAKAVEVFENVQPESPLSPAWGKQMALGMKERMCK
jgi:tetratricopeptide (TPR) repeat protein